jgi:hypothetical protein
MTSLMLYAHSYTPACRGRLEGGSTEGYLPSVEVTKQVSRDMTRIVDIKWVATAAGTILLQLLPMAPAMVYRCAESPQLLDHYLPPAQDGSHRMVSDEKGRRASNPEPDSHLS